LEQGLKHENRRERRKRQTRDAIVRAARELFLEQGFEETTLGEIAERADVASSTLFTHFATKADIFFADYELIVQDHIRVLETRDRARESAIEATIRWHRETGQRRLDIDWSWFSQIRRLIDADPILPALEHEQYRASERALIREIALDLGESETDLRPRLIAATKVGLLFALSRFLADHDFDLQQYSGVSLYVDECLRQAAATIAAVPVPEEARSSFLELREAG
jgi:AcrR family transcriptional regulator